jgi:hypothetical protein
MFFHDFLITDKPGAVRNIDHIVIGKNGVFAVETKARRKMKGCDGGKITVANDGLRFPWGIDQSSVAQASENAAWLSDWLSKMSDKPVGVGAILVFPGWFVERRSKMSLAVLSGSEIAANLPKLNGTATIESDVRRFAVMAEDRNRTVEH